MTNIYKVFEQIINQSKSKLLSNNQFAFRLGRSTEDAIYTLIPKVYNSLDKSSKAFYVFLDVQKGFDTVSYKILVAKLELLGIRGIVLQLFKSYLSERKHPTFLNNVRSDLTELGCGVPQGTVLGPVLFNNYVNDLFNFNSSGFVVVFADDTAIFGTVTPIILLKS